MIERILPMSVVTAESFERDTSGTLFPEEDAVIASEELRAARSYADAALDWFALPFSLPPGLRASPRWPSGMTGSVTCCPGYRAAAVAMTRDVALLAVDVKLNESVPDDGMLHLFARAEERERLEMLAVGVPGICWDRLLFSAKLAVYKLWFPLARWWLNLELADIVIDPYAGTFTANLLAPGPIIAGAPMTEMRGRWLADEGFLVTAIVVPAA